MNHKFPLNFIVAREMPSLIGAERMPLVILLHGVGGNERNLLPLAQAIDSRFLILSVQAPLKLGENAFAWFQVAFTPEPVIVPEEAEASRCGLIEFIDAAVRHFNADESKVYLVGFSQGAIMAASAALTAPEKVAGAVLMSGRILPEIKPHLAAKQNLRHLRVLVQHGEFDSKLPIRHARDSRSFFSELGIGVDYREYPMAHETSEQSLSDVVGWLRADK